MDLIDIHCHILPGVDDGSKSMEESLAMLRIAQQNAIRTIIVTPHNKPGRHNIHIPSMNVYIKQLQEQMGRVGLAIELIGGNELYYGTCTGAAWRRGKDDGGFQICTFGICSNG